MKELNDNYTEETHLQIVNLLSVNKLRFDEKHNLIQRLFMHWTY